jgi:hypothetical protein
MLNRRLAGGLLLSGLALCGLVWAAPAMAQSALAQRNTTQQSSKPTATKPAASKAATTKPAAAPAKKSPPKPLVYVDDNRSAKTADASGSQKPQNRDVTKAFQQNCPSVALTEDKAKAGYDVMFEREPGGKGVKSAFGLTNAVHKTSKIEVTSKSGKELFSETGHSTSQLVKDACTAIGTPGTKVAKN